MLLGLCDEGFDTSAGIFKEIWVQDDITFKLEQVVVDSRCLHLLPVAWWDYICMFVEDIKDYDPKYDCNGIISYIVDLDIEGSIDGKSDIFIDKLGNRYRYIILL